jgi:F-type H+-transporting ATPase subunit gamma
VEPLLDALRTISLGSWQQAVNKRTYLEAYHHDLRTMLMTLLPILECEYKTKATIRNIFLKNIDKKEVDDFELDLEMNKEKIKLLIVVGSERGLCGNFNGSVADKTLKKIKEFDVTTKYEVWALGSRSERYLKRNSIRPKKIFPFSQSSLPTVKNSVDLINVTKYEAKIQQLLPFDLPNTNEANTTPADEPIIETDLLNLIYQVAQQLLVFNLHDILMKSATAEHATRFTLMEEASQNADRLLEDINQDYQALRRQIITREMIELAAGAGLIKS